MATSKIEPTRLLSRTFVDIAVAGQIFKNGSHEPDDAH